jgi:DNA polymerase IV (DinB-like DNA polymerase)
MHVDMDAYFASVEQYRNHSELQGLPVCVGHDPKEGKGRGVVRAASYEARNHGIRAGMPVSRAYGLCPDAVFVRGDFQSYVDASNEFMALLREFGDEGRVRRASIDEAYIEVTFTCKKYEHPRELALEIQTTIKNSTKLPCSVGIAPNMSVAKIATGINKPMGITYVPQNPLEVVRFLAPLPVDALNGVGKVTAKRLQRYDIETLGQIQQMSVAELWPIMGKGSRWLHKRASGIDERPLVDNGPRIRRSISKDRTFLEDVEPEAVNYLHETISKICDRIAEKVKKKALQFRTVTVKLRYADYTTIQRSRTLPVSTGDVDMLRRVAREIFDKKRDPDRAVRLLGVKVSGLSENSTQMCLTNFL